MPKYGECSQCHAPGTVLAKRIGADPADTVPLCDKHAARGEVSHRFIVYHETRSEE